MKPTSRHMLWLPLAVFTILAVPTVPCLAQGQSPRPEVVQMVEAFLGTVNGAETAADKFVTDHFTPEYQKARSTEERRKWFQSVRAKHGKITLAGLRRTAPDTFIIVVSTEKSGEAEFEVVHDDKFRISGLGLKEGGGE